jgi:acetyl esterase/lipase
MVVHHHADVVYTTLPGYRPLALDLYVDDAPRALCVFLHGGGWRLGCRRDGPGPVGPSSQLFFHRMAERGLAVAPIDYRLSGEATHPAQLDDVVAACGFLADHGADLRTDDLPLTLWGVSSGAHLAGLAALASPVGDRIVAVASWSAPSDLAALPDDIEAIGGTADRGMGSRESALLGVPMGDHPDLARAASPVAHVRATATAFQIVHGTADEHIPIAQSQRFRTALESAGVTVETSFVEGANHFFSTVTATRLAEVVDGSIDFLLRVATG